MPTPRWQEIHNALKERIETGELGPNAPLPAETDLAEEYGVSRLTAHRALYELQRAGLVVRRRRVGTVVAETPAAPPTVIAAVVFDPTDYFEGKHLSSLRAALPEDHHLVWFQSGRDAHREASILRRLSREAAGTVVFPTCAPDNDAVLCKLASMTPVVCIDRVPESMQVDAVMTDNYAAARAGLAHLAAQGHTQIAHFTDDEMEVSSVRDRYRAHQDFSSENGVGDPTQLVRLFPPLAPSSAREYARLVQMVHDSLYTLMNGPNPPTAVFGLRDHYASAIQEASNRMGVRIPEDLSVVCFVDRPSWLLRISDAVVRIEQDVEEIGRLAAERIHLRLAEEDLPAQRILVPARIEAAAATLVR